MLLLELRTVHLVACRALDQVTLLMLHHNNGRRQGQCLRLLPAVRADPSTDWHACAQGKLLGRRAPRIEHFRGRVLDFLDLLERDDRGNVLSALPRIEECNSRAFCIAITRCLTPLKRSCFDNAGQRDVVSLTCSDLDLFIQRLN